jgi:hypothetical protein
LHIKKTYYLCSIITNKTNNKMNNTNLTLSQFLDDEMMSQMDVYENDILDSDEWTIEGFSKLAGL